MHISGAVFPSYPSHFSTSPVYAYTLFAEHEPSYAVYHHGALKGPVVHETKWAKEYDAWLYEYGSRHTTLTLLKTREALDYGFHAMYAEAWELRIPLFGVNAASVPGDDSCRHLFFDVGRHEPLHLQWDNKEPDRWIALTVWLNRIESYFRQRLSFAPVEDPRTHVAAILRSECLIQDLGGKQLQIGPTVHPPPGDALRAFEATLPAPLPVDYRLIFDAESEGFGNFSIRLGKDLLRLYSIEEIQERRASGYIPKTVSHEGQTQHVIPFAEDEKGLLLMQLADAKRVWRRTNDGAQLEAETLALFLTNAIHRARQLAEDAFDAHILWRAAERRRREQDS